MQGCAVRLGLSADCGWVHAESQHSPKRLSLALQRGKDESVLLLSQARRARQSLDVGPTSQTERRGQGQRSASLQEMCGRGEVAVVDGRIAVRAVNRGPSARQHINELNLHAAFSRDPGPADEPKCVVELFSETIHSSALGGLNDHAGYLGDVARQLPIADRILRHKPEQVWSLEESIKGVADLVA